MWIVTDDETGAVVAGPLEDVPEAGEGETLRRVPQGTVWSVEKLGFIDPPVRWIDKGDYVDLWPKPAIASVLNSMNPDMAHAWARFLTWTGPINLDDPLVVGGIDLAAALGILTVPQAQRIKDGLPPL